MGAKKNYNTRDVYSSWETNTLTFEATETTVFLENGSSDGDWVMV